MEDTEDAQDAWTKPATTFKIKRTKSTGRPSFSSISKQSITSNSVKRMNPFGTVSDPNRGEASKRPRIEDTLGRRISELKPGQVTESGDSHDSGLELSSPPGPECEGLRTPPLDWSLKARARFTSRHSFGWTQHLTTVEEASGITGGVRCLGLSRGAHCLNTSLRAQLHAATLYWQHPSLPVPLFPRYSQSSLRTSAAPSLSLSPDMQRALQSDWMSSLQSAYQLVKARQCPYFYLLAPNFTVLFRAAGVAGTQELTAIVAPSTSGLRSALKREDVEFSLPLFKPRKEEDEEAGVPETDSTTEFLESLGIEADSLPGLANPTPKNRLAAGHGSGKNIDGRAESLLLIEGVECQSLLNYLLNAKLTLGQGVAALPPTLLAPVAFQGAVLRSLKLRQTAVTSHGSTQHAMELTGPILPSNQRRWRRRPLRRQALETCQEVKQEIKMEAVGETGHFRKLSHAASDKERGEGTRRRDSYEDDSAVEGNSKQDDPGKETDVKTRSHLHQPLLLHRAPRLGLSRLQKPSGIHDITIIKDISFDEASHSDCEVSFIKEE